MTTSSSRLRPLLRSSALRASAVFGVSGLALACANLLLARCLPPVEFARFALLFAIVMIGITIGPIGADVLLMRRRFEPNARLHRQVALTSGLVAAALVLCSGGLYSLPPSLLATIGISIIAGGVKTVGVAHYRSRGRLSAALLRSPSRRRALADVTPTQRASLTEAVGHRRLRAWWRRSKVAEGHGEPIRADVAVWQRWSRDLLSSPEHRPLFCVCEARACAIDRP